MKTHSEKIIELDPDYKDGGGYFMLGVVHLRTPYVPFFLSWPDKDEAERLLKIAEKCGNVRDCEAKVLVEGLVFQTL